MPLQEQLVYLGQRSIEKYGCYSCHDIKGFEGLKPIGTELTIEGSKSAAPLRLRLRRDSRTYTARERDKPGARPAHRAFVGLQQGPQPARLRRPRTKPTTTS